MSEVVKRSVGEGPRGRYSRHTPGEADWVCCKVYMQVSGKGAPIKIVMQPVVDIPWLETDEQTALVCIGGDG